MDNNNNYNYGNSNQGYYNNGPYMQPTPPVPPKKGCGFGIASLVVGILSLSLCCVGGCILGVAGIALGIVSLCRKESKFGLAIGGIVTSVFGILIGIYMIAVVAFSVNVYDEIKDMDTDELRYWMEDYVDKLEEGRGYWDFKKSPSEEPFAEHSYMVEDGSAIYFYENGGFIWYQNDNDHDDNFYSGEYESYMGQHAQDYLTTELADYGVTEAELEEYYERNSDSDFYTRDNLCCLVIHSNTLYADGETQDYEATDRYYMGYYADGYFDAVNMDSAEYVSFTRSE